MPPSPRLVNDWLLALADPAGPPQALPAQPLCRHACAALCELADRHGLLAVVMSNLTEAVAAGGDRVLLGGEQSVDPQAKQRLARRVAHSMMVRAQTAEIAAELARREIPAVVIKGSDVADRLYPLPALRTFSDLDLLAARDAARDAEAVLMQLGYKSAQPEMKHDAEYGETMWTRPHRPGGCVEIHWNLVNSPSLRRGVSVTYDDLQLERVDGPLPRRPSPASLLLIAAVHGAASHAFDRLLLLCDVRQAVRQGGAIDEAFLAEAVARTGAARAMSASLDLTRRVLGDDDCLQMRRRLGVGGASLLCRLALSRRVILRGHDTRDSWRRQVFRQTLKRR